jgi:hypothetical protein
MASLSITASQVLLVSGEAPWGTAGAAITAGDGIYFDSATNTWKLAQSDSDAENAGASGLGIALNDAASGQPVRVAGPGCDVNLGAGAAAAASVVYIPAATAGDLAAYGDVVTSGHFRSVICIGKGSNRVRVIGRAAESAIA